MLKILNKLDTVLMIPNGPDGELTIPPHAEAEVTKINEALRKLEAAETIQIVYPRRNRRTRDDGGSEGSADDGGKEADADDDSEMSVAEAMAAHKGAGSSEAAQP